MNEITYSSEIVDVAAVAPLFPLGRIVATPCALDLGCDFTPYLAIHECGLWGEVGQEDWQENDLSVKEGFRIISVYVFESRRFWIISEAARHATATGPGAETDAGRRNRMVQEAGCNRPGCQGAVPARQGPT